MTAALERGLAPANHFSADVVDAAEIAETLGIDEALVRRDAAEWSRKYGFPRRLRPFGWFWSRAAIRRWMLVASGEGPKDDDADAGTAEIRPLSIVAQQRAALAARYGGRG
ncbi:hypothetical protein [Jiella avicenniae]|uniref:Uncharacterized protein n=1 Tax=Jiella avicenniae TaxID=2907202 RepID=A0A9X1T2M0_9HYPH|nr:hypothetical protein [Jiella avicenniae]MCE7026396.1 hypothetical protein [Jiella avicenniae]